MEKVNLRLPHVKEITAIAEKAGRLDPDWKDGYLDDSHDIGLKSSSTQAFESGPVSTPVSENVGRLDQVAAILGCSLSKFQETDKVDTIRSRSSVPTPLLTNTQLLMQGRTTTWKAHWGSSSLGFQALYTCKPRSPNPCLRAQSTYLIYFDGFP